MHRLLIVESPTKARTISRFLPAGKYKVMACMGHIRDLPSAAAEVPQKYRSEPWARLGVRIDNGFEPIYVISTGKRKVVRELKDALKDAEALLIATDEDREGEAIGWHLLEVLKPKVPVHRMVFHEITRKAIERALENTRQIDHRLVDAQETRRVLDRLVGYEVSPVLWRKIKPKLSAGRVQSVAVRLLVLRERERMEFVAASYWSLKGLLSKLEDDARFESILTHLGDQRIATSNDFDENTGKLKAALAQRGNVLVLSEEQARALASRAPEADWKVSDVQTKDVRRSPSPPFITSTLQQEASKKFGWSAKQTMRVAQKLYEKGHITYMRTDSVSLSNEAIQAARRAAETRYGSEYVSQQPRRYKGKVRNAQEAHEAIRPAGSQMKVAQELGIRDGQEARLYDLIWKRTVASQMAQALIRQTRATIDVRAEGGLQATFRATGQTVLFAGFMRAYVEGAEDPAALLAKKEKHLPELAPGESLQCHEVVPSGHQTKPPARYTEASLIKALESEGIGRPSTYAEVMDKVQRVGYATKVGRALAATFTAFASNNLLESGFDRLVDTGFTASLEEKLDNIASGKHDRQSFLTGFYTGSRGLAQRVADAQDSVDPKKISTIESPKWGAKQIRVGRYGPYVESEVGGEVKRASLPQDWLPADVTEEGLIELLQVGETPPLGRDAASGLEIYLKQGPYGLYCQLGEDAKGKDKPKRVSIPKNYKAEDITPEIARGLLALPRTLGTHPETGQEISAGQGRYGPYVRMDRTYASLKKEDDVLTVGLDRAVELLAAKKQRPMRVLGAHPKTGKDVMAGEGRYGPYVKHERTNASLKKDQSLDSITLDEAVVLLTAKAARGGKRRRTRARTRR